MVIYMSNLFRNNSYIRYLLATAIAAFGNGMYFVAVAWMLLEIGGAASSVATMLAVTTIPGILFSPWIGVIVDRMDRQKLFLAADIFRCVILLIIPTISAFSNLQHWHVYIVAFLLSVGDRVSIPAGGGLIREIIAKKDLPSANSLNSIATQTGALVGAGAAGFLIHVLGTQWAISVNSLTFLISACIIVGVHKERANNENRIKQTVYQDFVFGVRYLTGYPFLIGIALLQTVVYITIYSTNVLLPVFVKVDMKFSSREFGLIDSAWAAGAIIGGIFLLKITMSRSFQLSVTKVLFALSISIVVFLTSDFLAQAVLGYFLMGLFFIICRIMLETTLQSEVPTDLQGRVRSSIMMIIAYVSLVVYAAVGYLAEAINTRTVYALLAFVVFSGSIMASVIYVKLKRSNIDLEEA